ncbi:MAG TPA: hypothetical protein VFM74_00950 [Candidatus Limnocylindria bacterium]|nr:hypothetical protein [Candidatus Limnocylindria bacterium]
MAVPPRVAHHREVFDEAAIGGLVSLLERREASLWHACQLIDLAAYLQVGGIAARSELARRDLACTPLASDQADRDSGHWDKVPFNLDDIGQGFAAGWRMTPNVFGPIVLQVSPSALTDATDASVTLRSPSAAGFDPQRDEVGDADVVDTLFLHDAEMGFPLSSFVLYGERLRAAVGVEEGRTIEVFATPRRGQLSLRHVVAIWVDPVEIASGTQLIDVVSGLAEYVGVPLRIRPRTRLDAERRRVWRDIVHVLEDGERPLRQVVNRADVSAAFRMWARNIDAAGLDWMWGRFGAYLCAGTLRYLRASQADVIAAADGQVEAGFWSAARRARAGFGTAMLAAAAERVASAEEARPAVRACGHLAQSWDSGVCYVCIGRTRSRWRYEE